MQGENKTNDLLDEAIRSYRDVGLPRETLSDHARSAVIDAARNPGGWSRAYANLFMPWRNLALVGALVVMAFMVLSTLDTANPPNSNSPAIEVAKVGDRVIFNIANGKEKHVVARSEFPDRFDRSAEISISDSYVDRLDAGPKLVFYRID